jgi:hypothetical protein
MNMLWKMSWVPEARAFKYSNQVISDPSDLNPAPDLNLLAPYVFEWLYQKTDEVTFRARGEEIFTRWSRAKLSRQSRKWVQAVESAVFTSFEYVELHNAPRLELLINDVTVSEVITVQPRLSFTVSLSSASPNAASVNYTTVNYTATSEADYVSATNTLSFAPGETTKTIACR